MNSVLDFTFQSQAVSFAAGNSAKNLQIAVRGRRLLHDARLVGDGAADVPRQPRHGPRRLLPAVDGCPAAARRARARAALPHARPARRLLRRRAGLRRHGRRQGRPPDAVRDARSPSTRTSRSSPARPAGSVDRYDTDAPLYEHIAEPSPPARGPPGARHGRPDRALRRQRRRRLRVLPRRPRPSRSSTSSPRTTRAPTKTVDVDTLTKAARSTRCTATDTPADGRRRRRRHPSPSRRSAPSC